MVTVIVAQGVVGNPVQLTVGKATRLLLDVTRDPASSNHTIEGLVQIRVNSGSQQQVEEDAKRCFAFFF